MLNKISLTLLITIFISGCSLIVEDKKPDKIDDACYILKTNKSWNRALYFAEKKWNVPKHVLLSIMYQESSFNHNARPLDGKFLFFFNRYKSTARGYSQALDGTWKEYKKLNDKGFFTNRKSFSDSADFMGWYLHRTHMQTGIPKWKSRDLYLAYHEGNGGYMRKTYKNKPWLIKTADTVAKRSWRYAKQIENCDFNVGWLDRIIYKY